MNTAALVFLCLASITLLIQLYYLICYTDKKSFIFTSIITVFLVLALIFAFKDNKEETTTEPTIESPYDYTSKLITVRDNKGNIKFEYDGFIKDLTFCTDEKGSFMSFTLKDGAVKMIYFTIYDTVTIQEYVVVPNN